MLRSIRIWKKYPWLMIYLRADATKGFPRGYHYICFNGNAQNYYLSVINMDTLTLFNRWFGIQLNLQSMGIDLK
ncbi:hypothetical protein RchiOBHm_Chr5g0009721 [Rosa chinensis]|uniref:DUF7705 domain-containing protein n=1 Tax=Rosa chinensis TaxID=74649 RepID=A0A2P6Q4E4_ROSCH|nr:hypothetical protein RchiOBHm_Chr5g0009721 [Rosa chinensis]